ncbi:MAG: hypothetical protein LRZ84_14140 [Desertifilum sp.]|nr:hypothetical protein [Desertifilum sp.]MDI9634250.1 hypothetical protein [Geitlerinema splendidum]
MSVWLLNAASLLKRSCNLAIAQYLGEEPNRTERRLNDLEREMQTWRDRFAELNTAYERLQQLREILRAFYRTT